MTIHEVEQAIRNLMISQPMITASPMGSTITNILSVIDNFKNFKLSIQAYPIQDSFKFVSFNECQRLENTLSLSACQILQEKGINLMTYLTPMPNAFNPMPQMPNQNMMGQVMFSQPMQQPMPQPMGQPRPMGQFNPMNEKQNVQFNRPFDMQNRMMNGQQPMQQASQSIYQRPNQPQFNNQNSMFYNQFGEQQPKTNSRGSQIFASQFQSQSDFQEQKPIEPFTKKSTKLNEVEMLKPISKPAAPAKQPKPKTTPTVQVQMNEPEPPPMLMEEPALNEQVAPKKAAGRDYLLQLLKK